jgi:hypothetical protein
MKSKLKKWAKMLFNVVYEGSLLQRDIRKAQGLSEEAVWHHVFRESFRQGEDLPLHMGRWAGGASFFYVLHRVLDAVQPAYVLEMGLGESTKFIAHHAARSERTCRHVVIEHDTNWIRHFESREALGGKSVIEMVPLATRSGSEDGVRGLAYEAIDAAHWNQAQVVVIDGPYGRGEFARSNVLDWVPYLTPERSFVALFDDSHRSGELRTIAEFMARLEAAGIAAKRREYGGSKSCTLVCSSDLSWLTTL